MRDASKQHEVILGGGGRAEKGDKPRDEWLDDGPEVRIVNVFHRLAEESIECELEELEAVLFLLRCISGIAVLLCSSPFFGDALVLATDAIEDNIEVRHEPFEESFGASPELHIICMSMDVAEEVEGDGAERR